MHLFYNNPNQKVSFLSNNNLKKKYFVFIHKIVIFQIQTQIAIL